MLPRVIIITGPTASGKTELSELIAQKYSGTIINADMGQFYRPLTIGTAKPDWKNKPFKCLLFDILDQPLELNSAAYRTKVLQAIAEIVAEGKMPIIVGGSLFYIKSLFFPPSQIPISEQVRNVDFTQSTEVLLGMLKSIDVDRAQHIHPHDRYRIVRALKLWQQTGIKPSQQKPVFAPSFRALVISIEPPRDVLKKCIEQRTHVMFQQGLIDEARSFLNTDWEAFLEKKGLIGYREIFEWMRAGQQPSLLEATKDLISQKTWQYAKRQLTFLSTFKEDLVREGTKQPGTVQALTISQSTYTPDLDYSIRKFAKA